MIRKSRKTTPAQFTRALRKKALEKGWEFYVFEGDSCLLYVVRRPDQSLLYLYNTAPERLTRAHVDWVMRSRFNDSYDGWYRTTGEMFKRESAFNHVSPGFREAMRKARKELL